MMRGSEAVRGCKGCGDEFRVTEGQIERALAVLEAEPERLVPDPLYAARLAACDSCEKLMHGTTCRVCGCFVQVAAKLKDRRCPLPGGGRWP